MAQKKIFANLFSRTRGATEGYLNCVIEYTFITGVPRSGKMSAEIGPVSNESGMQDDLKDALLTHLSTKYPTEQFQTRDIIGLGV